MTRSALRNRGAKGLRKRCKTYPHRLGEGNVRRRPMCRPRPARRIRGSAFFMAQLISERCIFADHVLVDQKTARALKNETEMSRGPALVLHSIFNACSNGNSLCRAKPMCQGFAKTARGVPALTERRQLPSHTDVQNASFRTQSRFCALQGATGCWKTHPRGPGFGGSKCCPDF